MSGLLHLRPLDRKLLRDLGRMRAQVIAIALVIAVGVLTQVMMSGLVASLGETRRAYYERNRMADIFAPLARAPESLLPRLAALPGVARAEGRIQGSALIDMPGTTVPIQARTLSLPDRGQQVLNLVYLTEGRLPAAASQHEALILDGFAKAHGLRPGDRLQVTMNGARRSLRITGLAQAPDLLYVAVPGEMSPDPARIGVIWLRRAGLAAAYDMAGAFNEASATLRRGASEQAVIDEIDRLLKPYGATGAYGLDGSISDRFVSEEIDGLKTMSRIVPPLFLGVAAFLLYIVVSRLVQTEREEIGLLKAFGYTDSEVGRHYFKFVLIVAMAGAALGCVLGILAGRSMIPVYTTFYNFPFLVFRPDPASFAIGILASVAAASTGGLFVLRRVFALTPAEAMRPPAPPDFSKSIDFRGGLGRRLDQPVRMILRGIARQPWRMVALIAGMAGGMALAAGMTTIYTSFERMMTTMFTVIDRSDATVTFTRAVSVGAAYDLATMEGVRYVEPVRDVSVILRNGLHSHRTGINGMVGDPILSRAVDADVRPIPLPESGVVLSQVLADILRIEPGQMLTVDVRQGRQPVLVLPVTGIAESLVGAPAYMRLDALNRALHEPDRISGVHLSVDAAHAKALYARLKTMPTVAGVSVAADAQESLKRMMDEGVGMMRYIMGAIAFTISFGIVYNAARIGLNERARDLASLRVMGFSRGEAAFVLLGELGVLTLIAVPLGSLGGWGLSFALATSFSTEFYQVPTEFVPWAHGFAACFVLGAAVVSGLLVKRDLDRMDLIETLKTRE